MERRSPRSLHNKEGAGPVRAGSPAVFTPAASSHWAERSRPPESQAQAPGPWALSPPAFSFLPLSPPGSHSPRPRAWLCMGVTQWPCRSEVLGRAERQFPFCDIPFPGPSLSQLGFLLRNWRPPLCPDPARNLSWLVVHSWRPPGSQLD